MAKAPNDKVVINKVPVGITTPTPATGKDALATISNSLASYFNQTLATLRNNGRTLEAIRTLARVHGDVSAAVSTAVRLADTDIRYSVYDSDHQLSPEGSTLLRSVLVRLNNQFDYSTGFDDRMPVETAITTLLRSIPLTGACALELVIDQTGLPYRLQPFSVEPLKFKVGKSKIGKETNKMIPYLTGTDGDLDLDFPTIFYSSLDQDMTSAYASSPLEPAVNTSIFHAETVDDIRRVVKRSGHSRLVVKLLTEQVINSAPMQVRSDPEKLSAWVENVRVKIRDEIEKLPPEAALVFFDNIEADYLNSEIGASADYKPLMETIDSILATALKTPAAIVGKRTSGGSQNTSSTESLLYIKTATGHHKPVQAVLSRALTLAVRLFGFDGYVVAKFEPIDLRPEEELEAFKTMRQQRILELLSLGFISDDEAGEMLRTGPRAPGAPKLSGTMFYGAAKQETPSANGDPARSALTPTTPKAGGGKSNKSA
jgi:hypothetical protein